jgi:hypothetical protein
MLGRLGVDPARIDDELKSWECDLAPYRRSCDRSVLREYLDVAKVDLVCRRCRAGQATHIFGTAAAVLYASTDRSTTPFFCVVPVFLAVHVQAVSAVTDNERRPVIVIGVTSARRAPALTMSWVGASVRLRRHR